MGLFDAITASGSGLSAERMRMDVTSENLANAQTAGYRRKDVVFQEVLDGAQGKGVQVSQIVQDPTPNRQVYDPSNPAANAQGYVSMPNVNPVTEMVDLITASRGYEADVQALNAAKTMFQRTLDLLR
jgi:flagellar basal-body rod protein FlgC